MTASGLFRMAVPFLPLSLFLSLDRIPQILNVATELEFNLGTMPRINCAAAGNPFPVRGSMELRKPDGTMLLVRSQMAPCSRWHRLLPCLTSLTVHSLGP